MTLYRRFPRISTLWCLIEVFIYGGQLFGWASILFVLKKEGFYEDLCTYDESEIKYSQTSLANNKEKINQTSYSIGQYSIKDNSTNQSGSLNHSVSIGQFEIDSNQISQSEFTKEYLPGCYAQEAKLNLWFSIAICTAYVACSGMGPLMNKIGMRSFRIISM